MIFALDVGNTNIVLGVFGSDYKQLCSWRIATDNTKTEDELYVIIRNFFVDKNIKFEDFDGVVISSVVPKMMFALELLSKKYFKKEPIIVSAGIKTGIKVPAPYSSKLGADRVVDIVGSKVSGYLPAIIVDLGTATTFDCVDEEMNYRGGIELEAVSTSLGMDTTSQMQAGFFYGFLGQFENIITHLKKDLGGDYKVVLTGGLSKFIAKYSSSVDIVDEELTLKGIIELYKMNKEK